MRHLLVFIFILAAFGLTTVPALLAQDSFGAAVSAQTVARAGVYIPSSDNALDALSLNPAGLSSLTGPVLNLSAIGLLARGSFSNSANQDSPMRQSGGIVPFGAFGLPLGNRWTLAAGIVPDLLSEAKWQFEDTRGSMGADYGPQHEAAQLLAFRGTAGVSYRISSRISVGVAVGAIYNSTTLIMPYVFHDNPALGGLKTLFDLHATGIGWNSSFGVTAKPTGHWELGASFRTRSSIKSNGSATGNMGAQLAVLQVPLPPAFSYSAQLRTQLPQGALFSAAWQKSPLLRFSVQSTWTNWKHSFASLPISLTNGTNAGINGFLNSNALKEVIPLDWNDQYSFRAAVERWLGERFVASGGYVYQNSPVPSSTLSPMASPIMKNTLAAGVGWIRGRARFDIAYGFSFMAGQSVGTSALSEEFDDSRVRMGAQALTISTSFHL